MKLIQPEISDISVSEDCLKLYQGTFIRFGFQISNFYRVEELLPYDIDNNGTMDSIAILMPFYRGNDAAERACRRSSSTGNDSIKENILVVMLLKGKSNVESLAFPNALINAHWAISREELLLVDGLPVIQGTLGGNNTFTSKLYLGYSGNQLYIDTLTITSEGLYQYSERFPLNVPLNVYRNSIVDSLRGIVEEKLGTE